MSESNSLTLPLNPNSLLRDNRRSWWHYSGKVTILSSYTLSYAQYPLLPLHFLTALNRRFASAIQSKTIHYLLIIGMKTNLRSPTLKQPSETQMNHNPRTNSRFLEDSQPNLTTCDGGIYVPISDSLNAVEPPIATSAGEGVTLSPHHL